MAKKWLRFHALFYKSLKISFSKNGAWPRPDGKICTQAKTLQPPVGGFESVLRGLRYVYEILESCEFFEV